MYNIGKKALLGRIKCITAATFLDGKINEHFSSWKTHYHHLSYTAFHNVTLTHLGGNIMYLPHFYTQE